MGKGVNKVIIVGYVGKEPEMRGNQNMPVATFSVATKESWKDKQTGEQKEETEWHNLVFFGRQADYVGRQVTKGTQVFIEGRLKTEKWKDQNGNDRYTTKVIGKEIQIISGWKQNNQHTAAQQPQQGYPQNPQGYPQQGQPQQAYAPPQGYAQTQQAPQPQQQPPQQNNGNYFDPDQDIPFS